MCLLDGSLPAGNTDGNHALMHIDESMHTYLASRTTSYGAKNDSLNPFSDRHAFKVKETLMDFLFNNI